MESPFGNIVQPVGPAVVLEDQNMKTKCLNWSWVIGLVIGRV